MRITHGYVAEEVGDMGRIEYGLAPTREAAILDLQDKLHRQAQEAYHHEQSMTAASLAMDPEGFWK